MSVSIHEILWSHVTWLAAGVGERILDIGEPDRLRSPASFKGNWASASAYYSNEERGLQPGQITLYVDAVKKGIKIPGPQNFRRHIRF